MSYRSEQLTLRASQWNVAIDEVRETESSVLGFGSRDGDPVVLKLSKHTGDEWNSGDVLRAFDGHGTVRVYQSDGGAVLLERLEPGTELVELVRAGRDEEATSILAQVMKRMSNHAPPAGCPTLFDWARGFDRYVNDFDARPISLTLVQEAAEIYRRLAASQNQLMLLHGDLHHYNMLRDANRGWLAIDPKGVVGELEYELGAMIRNPIEQPDYFTAPEIVERRLRTLTEVLDLNYERALAWSFAQSVLSAVWDIEDGFHVSLEYPALRLAVVIRALLA